MLATQAPVDGIHARGEGALSRDEPIAPLSPHPGIAEWLADLDALLACQLIPPEGSFVVPFDDIVAGAIEVAEFFLRRAVTALPRLPIRRERGPHRSEERRVGKECRSR